MGMINDLQMMMICCEKLLNKAIEENPKAGVITQKGTPEETKMKYTAALKTLKRLNAYFGLRGTTTLGMCISCRNWDTRGFTPTSLGKCKIRATKRDYHPDIYHAFDTCDKHANLVTEDV